MEEKKLTYSDFYDDVVASLASLEQIVKLKANSANEKCTACRQQYILFKYLNQNISDDIAMRNWIQNRSTVEYHQEICKDLNIFHANNGRYRKMGFPRMDISCSVNIDTSNEMFEEEYLKISLEESENAVELVNEPMVRNRESPSKKARTTREKFLNGQMPIESNHFSSARQILAVQTLKKQLRPDYASHPARIIETYSQKTYDLNFSATKRSLGSLGRIVNSSRKNFNSPKRSQSSTNEELKCDKPVNSEIVSIMAHPALKNVDFKMVELINNEIIYEFKPVDWNEIAGLHYAKSIIKEAVVYPLLRPDIFTGLRTPPKGILLFGPPGTGKTLIGKCIASQSNSTFFNISSATLTSKWMGEGEKMVRALFAVAAARQPSVIFIDEIDALLSQRSENENEGTRRLKTEFLIRLDGTSTSDEDRVLIVGATNRPQELDEAVRRRFVKRLYVPLPESDARAEILSNLLQTVENNLNANHIEEVSKLTEGYSGADMDSLCREASMEPLRSLSAETIVTYPKENLRRVSIEDFYIALKKMRPSVSQNDLSQLVEWNKMFGLNF